jgi:hypothetical protein
MALFGYDLEPDFDIRKEERWDRIGHVLIAATVLCGIYLLSGFRFAVQFFQACIATVLCYGVNFYVNQRTGLAEPWLWKAVLRSLPFHISYLIAVFWSDAAFPSVMTKAIVFIPVLVVGFGIESVLIDHIADRLKCRSGKRAG